MKITAKLPVRKNRSLVRQSPPSLVPFSGTENLFRLVTPIRITGKGNSLWCETEESKRTFVVGQIEFCYEDIVNGVFYPGHIQLYGGDTRWNHYTDSGIEREVKKAFLPIVQARYPHLKITDISWSEQGAQPAFGWDFDICYDV